MTYDSRQPNRIAQAQNEPAQLQRLGAQRYLYGQAKKVLATQMILGAPIAILVVLVTWHWSHLRFAAATFGVVAFLLDMFFLTPWQSRLRETAAKIQEAFDCDVLGLPWSKQKAGKKIDHEVEIDCSIRYLRVSAKYHPITNWYPVAVGKLHLPVARALCQRTNCWWDSQQRRLYVKGLLVMLFVVIATTAGVAMGANWSLQEYTLMMGLPLLPFIRVLLMQIRDHRDAATRLDKLKDDAKDLFDEARNDPMKSALEASSRALQDEIFESRKRNPPLFDWIFKLIRPSYEVQMNLSAEQLVEQACSSSKNA